MNIKDISQAVGVLSKHLGVQEDKDIWLERAVKELDKAITAFPSDMVMRRAAAVLHNRLSKNSLATIKASELQSIFNTFDNMASSQPSKYKQAMADFLPSQGKPQEDKPAPQNVRYTESYRGSPEDVKRNMPQVQHQDIQSPLQEKKELPKTLKPMVEEMENNLMAAAIPNFKTDTVKMSRAIVEAQLVNMGYKNYQVKLSNYDNKGIVYSTSLPTPNGMFTINIPVEISKNKGKEDVLIPSSFNVSDKSASLTRDSIDKLSSEVSESQKMPIMIDGKEVSSEETSLRDQLFRSALNKDYNKCTELLKTLQSKVSEKEYIKVISQYQDILQKVSKGDIEFKPSTSSRAMSAITPYSARNGLKDPKEVDKDLLDNEGVAISTSKIILT